jgi:hypothetical protein
LEKNALTRRARKCTSQNARHTGTIAAFFFGKSWYKSDRIERVTRNAGWKNVKFLGKEAYLNLGTDLRRWATIAWTFLATPVDGWQQRDEDRWDEALNSIVEGLSRCDGFKIEDGVHKIRMVADTAIAQK